MESDWNDEAEAAPRPVRISALRGAWIWAGVRMAAGSLVLLALIGLRIIQASPSDPSDASSEATEAAVALEGTAAFAESPATKDASASAESAAEPGAGSASLLSRMTDSLPGGGTGTDAADRMVSCSFSGGTRFMTAADCALRGGRAKVFEARE